MHRPAHVTFIHGLGNKPCRRELRRIWLEALGAPLKEDAGFDLGAVGVTASFVYWADLFYPEPLAAAHYESRADQLAASVAADPQLVDDDWTRSLLAKYPSTFAEAPVTEEDGGFERVPLPGPVKEHLMRHFFREAHDYLFDVDGKRQTIRRRVQEDFAAVSPNLCHVLVGHSQGSFIAYDVLTAVPECKIVDGLLTLGSPLGIDEIQERLAWNRRDGFPPNLHGDWVNVYDDWDVIARPDPRLANDFRKDGKVAVIDVNENNWGTWRHSATKYFKGRRLREHLRQLCGRADA